MAKSDRELLAGVGPRLRRVREDQQVTLAALSEATGISTSTLSRLESGDRRATLELLLPIARSYQLPLEELIGTLTTPDPRVPLRARRRRGRAMIPLTRRPGGMKAYKMQFDPEPEPTGELGSHEGYDWIYVLSGRLRLRLGDLDLVLAAGEVAEFDTHTPHWFTSAGPGPVEILVLFNAQGERLHAKLPA